MDTKSRTGIRTNRGFLLAGLMVFSFGLSVANAGTYDRYPAKIMALMAINEDEVQFTIKGESTIWHIRKSQVGATNLNRMYSNLLTALTNGNDLYIHFGTEYQPIGATDVDRVTIYAQ